MLSRMTCSSASRASFDSLAALCGMTASIASRARSAACAAASLTWTSAATRAGPVSALRLRRFAFRLDDHRCKLSDLQLRIADAVVDTGEQGREAVLLLGDLGVRQGQSVAGFNRGIAQPTEFGLHGFRRPGQPVRAALRFADGLADAVPDLGRQLVDALAQRGGALGERVDRAILGARLHGERVELGPRPRQGVEEMRRALVAIGGEFGEALVDQR